MYEYIRGTIVDVGVDYATVETGGIGYILYCSSNTLKSLKTGAEDKLFIHLHVAEDVMAMYGFKTLDEREMFRKLMTVSRIGKKTALGILSVLTPSDIAMAIATDNAAAFDNVPGMGRKTAQRVILELKEKINVGAVAKADNGEAHKDSMMSDAIEALCALGFDGVSAGRAVGAVKEFSSTEELIKKALNIIGKK